MTLSHTTPPMHACQLHSSVHTTVTVDITSTKASNCNLYMVADFNYIQTFIGGRKVETLQQKYYYSAEDFHGSVNYIAQWII